MKRALPVVIFGSVLLAACSANQQSTQNTESLITPTEEAMAADQPTELVITDVELGEGPEATAGATVTVHYTGTLTDGSKFDSSVDRGEPFSFVLGAGQVIPGWDQGVAGMKVGGKRELTIPPALAYGAQALPGIPANSVLVFQVELLGVE